MMYQSVAGMHSLLKDAKRRASRLHVFDCASTAVHKHGGGVTDVYAFKEQASGNMYGCVYVGEPQQPLPHHPGAAGAQRGSHCSDPLIQTDGQVQPEETH